MYNNDMQITTLHEQAHACASNVMITWLTTSMDAFFSKLRFLAAFPCRIAYTERAHLSRAGMPVGATSSMQQAAEQTRCTHRI